MLKHFTKILLVCCLLTITTNAQTNLVPNPSFETYTMCPNATGQINNSSSWTGFANSPDYFNSCSPLYLNVPNSEFGFQYAHSGVAYAGIETFDQQVGNNYREIIGAKLTSTLIVGIKYYFSFFVNLGGGNYNTTYTDKMGLRFSTVPYSFSNPTAINNFANYYSMSMISDSINWTQLQGSFIADSTYKYIAIGNFFDDAHTDTLGFTPTLNQVAYYYIDDVCVSTDSIYNQIWTGIETLKNNQANTIKVFPNPVTDILNINASENMGQVQLINSIGQIVFSTEVKNNSSFTFSVLTIPNGIYMLRVKTKNNLLSSTINVIH